MTKNIQFSFCIITDNSDEACRRIDQVIHSIQYLGIPEYEIIVIGGKGNKLSVKADNIIKVDFDETQKRAWITKKKNEVVKLCKYENVVMMHDYFIFHRSWYRHYNEFFKEHQYDICCNPILLENGKRDYTDWLTWDHPIFGRQISLPYHNWSYTKNQYISGGYFIVKKQFLIDNPFDEGLVAGDEEDVKWSLKVRNKAKIICNPSSYCIHNKYHRNQTINTWTKLL